MDQQALDNIEKLHRLKGDGIITEEEFERAKKKYLFGSAPASATPKAVPPTSASGSMDEHIAWMTLPLKRYADFHGRSSRREFWMFQIIPVAIVLVGAFMFTSSFDLYGEPSNFGMLALFAMVLGLLGLLVPLLAVQARRFHDQGRSGWLVLINLVPYVGSLIVYVFMLMEGTKGENEYGPDPLS